MPEKTEEAMPTKAPGFELIHDCIGSSRSIPDKTALK